VRLEPEPAPPALEPEAPAALIDRLAITGVNPHFLSTAESEKNIFFSQNPVVTTIDTLSGNRIKYRLSRMSRAAAPATHALLPPVFSRSSGSRNTPTHYSGEPFIFPLQVGLGVYHFCTRPTKRSSVPARYPRRAILQSPSSEKKGRLLQNCRLGAWARWR